MSAMKRQSWRIVISWLAAMWLAQPRRRQLNNQRVIGVENIRQSSDSHRRNRENAESTVKRQTETKAGVYQQRRKSFVKL